MSGALDSFFADYARRYTEGDVEGVTSLCLWPFLAVRRGEAIHMPDRNAVWDHFASAIAAYRLAADAGKWTPVETDTRQLGEHSVFASVHWNALDADAEPPVVSGVEVDPELHHVARHDHQGDQTDGRRHRPWEEVASRDQFVRQQPRCPDEEHDEEPCPAERERHPDPGGAAAEFGQLHEEQ